MRRLFDESQAPERPDLPPLRGTEKQVPWATHVRNEKLAECERFIRERRLLAEAWESKGDTERAGRARAGLREAVDALARLEAELYSGWWLDRRDMPADELLREAGR